MPTKTSSSFRVARQPLEAFEQGYIYGQVVTYCEQVKAGAKLVGEMLFHKKHAALLRRLVADEGCKVIFDFNRAEDRAEAWIYKYRFMERLLKEARVRNPSGPRSALDTWITGKLFGYSDFEIARCIEQSGYFKNPLK